VSRGGEPLAVPALERRVDQGSRQAAERVAAVGRELRVARVGSGLSIESVASSTGISSSEISRIERGAAPRVPLAVLVQLAASVGLDLAVKSFPAGDPLRDAAQTRLVAWFGRGLHPTLRWATEVPLPIAGDRRAWDGFVAGVGWRFGVEAETQPVDEQALLRKLALKERDGRVDGVILLVPDTHRSRTFLRASSPMLAARFPANRRAVLRALARGERPDGSAVVVADSRLRWDGRPSR
jgi:transcriptional regulator with XRE-family HTH domain